MHLCLVLDPAEDLLLDCPSLLGRHVAGLEVAEQGVALDRSGLDFADGLDRCDQRWVVTWEDSVFPEVGETEGHCP